jgi:hypothetical protein
MHAEFGESADYPLDFVELEPLIRRLKGFEAFGHAVKTAQITTIGHRQPDILDPSPETIDQIGIRLPSRYPRARRHSC